MAVAPKTRQSMSVRRAVVMSGVLAVAVALVLPMTASASVSFCLGGLGPMGVCNQGHPHAIYAIGTSNSTGDLACETEKTGGATGSPLRYGWTCLYGIHATSYDHAPGYYAAVYNKTTGTRNMNNAFDYDY